MRTSALGAGLLLLLLGDAVQAQDEPFILTATRQNRSNQYCPPGTYPYYPPGSSSSPTDPMNPADPAAQQRLPGQDQLAAAPEAGTQPGERFNPNMFGDLIGIYGVRKVRLAPGATPVTVHGAPILGRYNGFKIADNESPRPADRIFYSYNYWNNVNGGAFPSGAPAINMQRQMFGFEKTFLNGDASIGMRLPFLQVFSGFDELRDHVVGDLSILGKYAWVNDRQTGNVLSTGLVVTVPTGGGNTPLIDGTSAPHSTLLQPWVGYIYNLDRVFFQGFASIVVPTDSRDPTIFFKSLGAGYWLYRSDTDRLLTGIVPVVELHLNTPLNHRSSSDPIFFQDQLNVTAGSYFIFPRMTIGGAVGAPLVGPKPYSVEAICNVNFRF